MANNTLQIFRTSIAGRQPNTTNSANTQYINAGSLALNMTDKILYTSDGTNLIYVGANQVNLNSNNLFVNSTLSIGVANVSYPFWNQQAITSNTSFNNLVNDTWLSDNVGITTNPTYISFYNGFNNQALNTNGSSQFDSIYIGNRTLVYNGTNVTSQSIPSSNGNISTAYVYDALFSNYANGASNNNTKAAFGYRSLIRTYSNATINTAYGFAAYVYPGNSTVTGNINTTYGFYSNIGSNTANAAAIGNTYHFFGVYPTSANITGNMFGIYVTNEGNNYLSSNLSIGGAISGQGNLYLINSSALLSIGNSTVNTFSNSTHFFSGNTTAYGFGNSIADVIVSPSGNITINATSIVINAATANVVIGNTTVYTFINTTTFSGTSNNATNLGGSPKTFYTNATNITTGTLPYAQIPANIVNTTAVFTLSGVHTYNANLTIIGNTTALFSAGNSTVNVSINATSISIPSNTGLLLGSNVTSNTATGWTLLPNGMKMNWGIAVVNSSISAIAGNTTSANVVFSNAFSSMFSMTVTPQSASLTGANDVYVSYALASANVKLNTAYTGAAVNVYFVAIGV